MGITERINQVKHAQKHNIQFTTLCKVRPFFKRYTFTATDQNWHTKLIGSLNNDLVAEQDAVLRVAPHFYSSTGDIKECVALARMLVNEVYYAEGED